MIPILATEISLRPLVGILLLCAAACTFGLTLPIKEGLWESVVNKDDGTVDFAHPRLPHPTKLCRDDDEDKFTSRL